MSSHWELSPFKCLFSHLSTENFALLMPLLVLFSSSAVKGKGRLWVLQHCCLEAYCTLTRMSSFIHPEALHTPSGVRDLC